MKKRIVAIISIVFILVFCIGCNKGEEVSKVKIGVSMPDKDELSWNQDGNTMKGALTNAGYEVYLQYADNDVDVQISQMKRMIQLGCTAIVLAPIDVEALEEVLLLAKEKGVTIISYSDIIPDNDAVSYSVAFDDTRIGYMQGQYIVDALELDFCPENQSYNIEIVTGNFGDEEAKAYYDGAMEVLKPYIDSGVLVIPSGAFSYEDTVIKAYDEANVDAPVSTYDRMLKLIDEYYFEELILDAVYCVDDGTALEVAMAVDYNYNGDFPVITGYGCNLDSARSIVDSKQTMTIFKDSGVLADKTVELLNNVLNNTMDNEAEKIYLCQPVCVDIDNYEELLIDSGYYTESQLD